MKVKTFGLLFCAVVALGSAIPNTFGQAKGIMGPRLKGYFTVRRTAGISAASTLSSVSTLPLFTFRVASNRDGNTYTGVMVGHSPFNGGSQAANVATKILPVVIKTHMVGTTVNRDGTISTIPGNTTFDPRATTPCLVSPNNVPLKLFQQSPLIQVADFNYGGTNVGTTQATDAFQRANFWKVIDRTRYHVILGPVTTLAPLTIDVPAVFGLALATTSLGPPAFCARMGIVDIGWFDAFLTGVVIPSLTAQGINPANFPIFFVQNVVWASPVTNLNTCCILGYHGLTGFPLPIQTYSPLDFDTTGLFTATGQTLDTIVASHEVGEWMNDPFGTNPTPAWGHTGQVPGCQNNLEVGDPLSGTEAPRIVMPNGFTYHLQELAFFSWFFNSHSIGIHSWFSNNGTFRTDAGPPCH